ncbi:hypothetical protein [Metabacillus sp. SLBN-84]
MKFFTDEVNNFDGYIKQLEQLRPRLSENVFAFLMGDTFHDAHIYSIQVRNGFNPYKGDEEKDPTSIEAHVLHADGERYLIKWTGVSRFLMDFDITRNTYIDSDEIVCDGQRGLDDWIVDEVTAYDDAYLSHEIVLASDARLIIRFLSLEIDKAS